jgi:hypothetical protein
MQTYTGIAFDFDDIKPEMVNAVDIAHSLAMQCRFNGHVSAFYSVAEHCCHVHDFLLAIDEHRWLALAGLLHDAAEAYMGDVVLPAKRRGLLSEEWARVELEIERAICSRFGVAAELLHHQTVKLVDRRILIDESLALTSQPPPRPWSEEKRGLQPLGITIQGWATHEARVQYMQRLRDRGAIHG